ncbi:MAG TPA: tetratricopeptide repeat protein [Gemmataceae bacterium]|nr:tetratricopeptide repeat protein [Gemmataceae bacterium]
MKRMCSCLAALLAVAVASPTASAQPNVVPVKPAPTGAGGDMQEDIEIMRRLLDGAFGKYYGVAGPRKSPPISTFADSSDSIDFAHRNYITPQEIGAHWKNIAVLIAALSGTGGVEGVYLKDYGVVYTATLPPTGFDPLPASKSASGTKTPPDDWDRVRKEIRGETPAPENKTVPAHQPLSEAILKVLADNGKHFNLADGERISVAVTFRGAANCTNCHQNPWGKGQPGAPVYGNQWQDLPSGDYYRYTTATSTTGAAATGTSTSSGGSSTQSSSGGGPAYMVDARNSILLGDLHLKQGKAKEAVDSYQQALQYLMAQPLTASSPKEEQIAALLAAVDVYNKLAAAYVQVGNSDNEAAAMLKKASELAKKAEDLTGATAPTPMGSETGAAAKTLPAKLVVTATKKQLEAVASGQMNFDMFCQAATVEYVNPPAAEKK